MHIVDTQCILVEYMHDRGKKNEWPPENIEEAGSGECGGVFEIFLLQK